MRHRGNSAARDGGRRRVVKKQGDDLDKSGCSGYDLDAGSQDYAVYSACSN